MNAGVPLQAAKTPEQPVIAANTGISLFKGAFDHLCQFLLLAR
jgi:hypothetical protein